MSDAERDLRAAQDALRQALERGATDEEIKKPTDELQALDRFMQALRTTPPGTSHPQRRHAAARAPPGGRPVEHGCPFDCGPCEATAEGPAAGGHHHQRLQPRLPHLLRPQQERRRLPHGRRGLPRDAGSPGADHGDELDIINFTGGEPTLHPQLPRLPGAGPRGGHPPGHRLHQRHPPGPGRGAGRAAGGAGGPGGAVVRHLRAGGRLRAAGGAACWPPSCAAWTCWRNTASTPR